MYLLYAPHDKFGVLPPKTALISDEVRFTNNIAYCPKFYWSKHHKIQGCRDVTPRWMRRLRSKRPLTSILFIPTGGFGDVMWTMPVIRHVRTLYPKARIFVATEARTLPLFLNFPYIDSVVTNHYWNLQNLISKSDDVFDFGGIATLLKKEMKMEPVEACFYHISIDRPKDPLLMLPHLVLTIDEGKQAESLLKRNGIDPARDTIISLSHESSTPNRNWPESYLYELATLLSKEKYKVILLSEHGCFKDLTSLACVCGYEFSFSSKNPPLAMSFTCPNCKMVTVTSNFGPPPEVLDLSSQTNYRMALALLALSNVFVGPASSLVIAATALNIPTIGLYGAFNPKRLLKYYRQFSYMYKILDCSPCSEHWTECPKGHPAPCMKYITPAAVLTRIKQMLQTYPRPAISKKPFD